MLAELRASDSATDNNYQRVAFKNNFNFQKLYSGVRGNLIISMIMDIVSKSTDYQMKFPMEQVNLNVFD